MNSIVIANAIERMTAFYDGNLHDVAHFIKVWGYARTIGILCRLDEETQLITELTAVVHDASIPRCRTLYGKADGNLQEQEAWTVVPPLMQAWDIPDPIAQRVTFLVAHHHTYTGVEGMDWQILLEADYLVNADEGNASPEAIASMRKKVFRTRAGITLLDQIYASKLK